MHKIPSPDATLPMPMSTCPIRQVISHFGDKWSLLVLHTLHTAPDAALRFGALHRAMSDCSQKMLSSTLRRLERYALVSRTVYPEVPPRVEYALTPKAHSLMQTLLPLFGWASEHLSEFTAVPEDVK